MDLLNLSESEKNGEEDMDGENTKKAKKKVDEKEIVSRLGPDFVNMLKTRHPVKRK